MCVAVGGGGEGRRQQPSITDSRRFDMPYSVIFFFSPDKCSENIHGSNNRLIEECQPQSKKGKHDCQNPKAHNNL